MTTLAHGAASLIPEGEKKKESDAPWWDREFGVRISHALSEKLADFVHSHDRCGYALYRLSLRPGPAAEKMLGDVGRSFAEWVESLWVDAGTILIRDVGRDGAPHFYGVACAPDEPGVPTKLLTKWGELANAAVPRFVAHCVARPRGWNLVRAGQPLGTLVPSKWVNEPFSNHLERIAGYAVKPWVAPDRTDGRARRLWLSQDHVIASGALAETWDDCVDRAIEGTADFLRGLLKPARRLWKTNEEKRDERDRLIAIAEAQISTRLAAISAA